MAIFSAIGGAILGGSLAGVAGGAAITFGVGAAAVGVAGAGYNKISAASDAARESARMQQRAAQTRVRMQQQQVARARRSAVRQQILARAKAQQTAQAAGVSETSALRGGLASISSQIGANLGYGSMMSGLGQEFTSLTGQAAMLQGQSQYLQAQGGALLGAAKFAVGGGFSGIASSVNRGPSFDPFSGVSS